MVVEGAEGPHEHAEVDGEALVGQEPVGLLHQPPRHDLEQVALARDQLHALGVLPRQPPQHVRAALRAEAELKGDAALTAPAEAGPGRLQAQRWRAATGLPGHSYHGKVYQCHAGVHAGMGDPAVISQSLV